MGTDEDRYADPGDGVGVAIHGGSCDVCRNPITSEPDRDPVGIAVDALCSTMAITSAGHVSAHFPIQNMYSERMFQKVAVQG